MLNIGSITTGNNVTNIIEISVVTAAAISHQLSGNLHNTQKKIPSSIGNNIKLTVNDFN